MEGSISKRFGALEDATKVFDDWKRRMDTAVEELCVEKGSLCKTAHGVVLDAGVDTSVGILLLPRPEAVAAASPGGKTAVGQYGHHVELQHRKFEFRSQLPVKGMLENPHPKFCVLEDAVRLISSNWPANWALGSAP